MFALSGAGKARGSGQHRSAVALTSTVNVPPPSPRGDVLGLAYDASARKASGSRLDLGPRKTGQRLIRTGVLRLVRWSSSRTGSPLALTNPTRWSPGPRSGKPGRPARTRSMEGRRAPSRCNDCAGKDAYSIPRGRPWSRNIDAQSSARPRMCGYERSHLRCRPYLSPAVQETSRSPKYRGARLYPALWNERLMTRLVGFEFGSCCCCRRAAPTGDSEGTAALRARALARVGPALVHDGLLAPVELAVEAMSSVLHGRLYKPARDPASRETRGSPPRLRSSPPWAEGVHPRATV